ncbi:MAG TPA: PIG-L deacetylase family protein [Ardenticatenaceae bacterium]|nr:PIG-L deacetylase family protein [Ardenticatenaceae bacterium]
MSTELPRFERAMVIVAHPDDPEFFVGGTVAQLAQHGTEVTYLILTDGSKGSDDRELSTRELIRTRREEQRRAAERLGVKHVIFFDYADGELRNAPDIQRDVVREMRRFRPDVVLTNDPQRFYYDSGYINHSDHRNTGAVVLDAVFPATRNFRYFPVLLEEGFEPHYVREVWLAGALEPDLEIDTTEVREQRLEAILAHVSQVGDGQRVRERIAEALEKEGRLVEKFKRIQLSGPPTPEEEEELPKDHAEDKLEAGLDLRDEPASAHPTPSRSTRN